MPVFSKPYRNLEQERPLYKAELLREIAARTYLKERVVEQVLETFKEVAIEEIVNKGAFNFSGLFSVGNYHTKETNTGMGLVPARLRLRTRLSERVKKIWNGRHRAGITEPQSFPELKESFLDQEGKDLRSSIGLLPLEPVELTGNPLLDDDDDY